MTIMMTRFFISLAALLCATAMQAQMTPRSVVTTAPEKLLLTIPASTLLDMLDYYESGVARTVRNKMDEDAVITEMTQSTISITTGVGRNVTFAILPYGKSSIIMTIDRVDTPETDASIAFYDARWKPIDSSKLLKLPLLADWTGKMPGERMREIENALPFLMADARFDPDTMTLSFTAQLGDYISVEDKDKVKDAIVPELAYRWNGKSFKPVK